VKQFLRRDGVQRFLAALIALYTRLVFATTRWTRVNAEYFTEPGNAGKPFLVAFWHGRLVMLQNFWTFGMQLYLLGSSHRDGMLMLRMLTHFGIYSIIGSSTRGGTKALREMVTKIREGHSIGLAPDGPRGPRMHAAPGIVAAAKLAGVPIVPIAYSVSHGRNMNSWDRFLFPLPFGRGAFVCAPPIVVPAHADAAALEAARQTLEDSLNAITAEADRICGRNPVVAAPLDAGGLAEKRA
jgi:lysophospholipid acyltransferase (LPLAT)-like uncharacterized protein